MSVGRLIARGLRCDLGAMNIGRDTKLPLHVGVTDMMKKLSVPRNIDFTVKNDY